MTLEERHPKSKSYSAESFLWPYYYYFRSGKSRGRPGPRAVGEQRNEHCHCDESHPSQGFWRVERHRKAQSHHKTLEMLGATQGRSAEAVNSCDRTIGPTVRRVPSRVGSEEVQCDRSVSLWDAKQLLCRNMWSVSFLLPRKLWVSNKWRT